MPGSRIAIIAGLTAVVCSSAAAAGEDDYDLNKFVGQNVAVVLEQLGEPTLQTPGQLWYSKEARISGGRPSPPNPGVVTGRKGATISGAGGTYMPLQFDREPCDITVTIGKDELVSEVEQAGPGCFEFIHLLRSRQPAPAQ